jgi:hypothetical protein
MIAAAPVVVPHLDEQIPEAVLPHFALLRVQFAFAVLPTPREKRKSVRANTGSTDKARQHLSLRNHTLHREQVL